MPDRHVINSKDLWATRYLLSLCDLASSLVMENKGKSKVDFMKGAGKCGALEAPNATKGDKGLSSKGFAKGKPDYLAQYVKGKAMDTMKGDTNYSLDKGTGKFTMEKGKCKPGDHYTKGSGVTTKGKGDTTGSDVTTKGKGDTTKGKRDTKGYDVSTKGKTDTKGYDVSTKGKGDTTKGKSDANYVTMKGKKGDTKGYAVTTKGFDATAKGDKGDTVKGKSDTTKGGHTKGKVMESHGKGPVDTPRFQPEEEPTPAPAKDTEVPKIDTAAVPPVGDTKDKLTNGGGKKDKKDCVA